MCVLSSSLTRSQLIQFTADDTYKKTDGLHPIPSILDLPSLEELEGEIDVGETSATANGAYRSELRNRNGTVVEDVLEKAKSAERGSRHGVSKRVEDGESIRRDADVLTKVIVCELDSLVVRESEWELISGSRFGYRVDRNDWDALGV